MPKLHIEKIVHITLNDTEAEYLREWLRVGQLPGSAKVAYTGPALVKAIALRDEMMRMLAVFTADEDDEDPELGFEYSRQRRSGK